MISNLRHRLPSANAVKLHKTILNKVNTYKKPQSSKIH